MASSLGWDLNHHLNHRGLSDARLPNLHEDAEAVELQRADDHELRALNPAGVRAAELFQREGLRPTSSGQPACTADNAAHGGVLSDKACERTNWRAPRTTPGLGVGCFFARGAEGSGSEQPLGPFGRGR